MAAVTDALKSESVPVAKLLGMAAPYNPRRIAPDQLAALGKSMRTSAPWSPWWRTGARAGSSVAISA